jgi:hypothetical protein
MVINILAILIALSLPIILMTQGQAVTWFSDASCSSFYLILDGLLIFLQFSERAAFTQWATSISLGNALFHGRYDGEETS